MYVCMYVCRYESKKTTMYVCMSILQLVGYVCMYVCMQILQIVGHDVCMYVCMYVCRYYRYVDTIGRRLQCMNVDLY